MKLKPLLFLFVFVNCVLALHAQDTKTLIDYYSKGELDKAFELSSKLISKEKENAVYNQLHGRILADLGKHEEAIFLLKAIQIDNDKTDISGWAHGYLGQCYFLLGQYENSKNSLNNCIKLNATNNSVKYANRRMFLFGFNEYFSSWKIADC